MIDKFSGMCATKNRNAHLENIVILIPTLEPDEKFLAYVKDLIDYGFKKIVVVNDGSNASYDKIFAEVEKNEECILLAHMENYGKGVALKTGYAYIKASLPSCCGIITVDSDGQHAISDVCAVAEALLQTPKTLLLGSRNFGLKGIPAKSKVGNRMSSALFLLLFGKWLGDTQTGLRGFDRSLLDKMLEIEGERFEYEMRVLAVCSTEKISMKTIEIQTIYESNNVGTHFYAVNDSLKIAKVLFGSIGRYSVSSGLSLVVDLAIAWFLLDFLIPIIPSNSLLRIGTATVIARCFSMLVNYTLNKKFVFHDAGKNLSSSLKYLFLCVVNMALSTMFVYVGSTGFVLSEKLVKVIGDTALFCMNYHVQRFWVFKEKHN